MKPDLRVRWAKRDQDGRLDGDGALVYTGPSPSGGLLAYVFETLAVHNSTLVKLLEENGYDLKTLQFSIRKRAACEAWCGQERKLPYSETFGRTYCTKKCRDAAERGL